MRVSSHNIQNLIKVRPDNSTIQGKLYTFFFIGNDTEIYRKAIHIGIHKISQEPKLHKLSQKPELTPLPIIHHF